MVWVRFHMPNNSWWSVISMGWGGWCTRAWGMERNPGVHTNSTRLCVECINVGRPILPRKQWRNKLWHLEQALFQEWSHQLRPPHCRRHQSSVLELACVLLCQGVIITREKRMEDRASEVVSELSAAALHSPKNGIQRWTVISEVIDGRYLRIHLTRQRLKMHALGRPSDTITNMARM